MFIQDFRPAVTYTSPLRNTTSERFGSSVVLQGFDLTGDAAHFLGAAPLQSDVTSPQKEETPISKKTSNGQKRRFRRKKAATAKSKLPKDETLGATSKPNGNTSLANSPIPQNGPANAFSLTLPNRTEKPKDLLNQVKSSRVNKKAPTKDLSNTNKSSVNRPKGVQRKNSKNAPTNGQKVQKQRPTRLQIQNNLIVEGDIQKIEHNPWKEVFQVPGAQALLE